MSTERVAVVIGGASGIGWAVARALAVDGCRVTVADRNMDGANDRAAELGGPHSAAHVEVTDEDSVQRLFEQAGPLDVAVNCAGFSNVGLITEMPVDQFRSVIDVCLTGAFIVAKHAGRRLRDGGVLVSITSLNARQPAAAMSAYCSAKAGLAMLTQVAALEMAPRRIRVNAVSPGFVHTPLTAPAAAVPGVIEDYLENNPAWPGGNARGHGRRRRLPVLGEGLLDHGRSARPQRWRAPDALPRCARARDETGCAVMGLEGKQAIVTGAGDTELLTLQQWNTIIDVNIRGVVKPRLAHAQWIFARLAPSLVQRTSIRFVAQQRASQADSKSAGR
jgi:3-oxoacyl-[acyl-carrier protein] reductase